MVQPSVCYYGKWVPAGIISELTHAEVLTQLNKLWEVRQEMIFRDTNISGVFPDYDQLLRAEGDKGESGGFEDDQITVVGQDQDQDLDDDELSPPPPPTTARTPTPKRSNTKPKPPTGNEADIDTD